MSDYGSEIEWTEEAELELARIEVAAATPPLPSPSRPAPKHIHIGLDRKKSLCEQFRRGNRLSVSDLVGPSWCEYQHSYRLLSKPYLPVAERPTTIFTASGNSINLNVKRAEVREVILDKGREVHKVIETQVMGDLEEVIVEANSDEEKWALRVINLIVGLVMLLETGRTRELPVFGLIDQFLVMGVIDEVDRRELPQLPPPSLHPASPPTQTLLSAPSLPSRAKKVEEPQSLGQRTLDGFFFLVSPSTKGKEKEGTWHFQSVRNWGFVVSDTKTRHSNSLPPKADSRASRLQLMLYHRLLSTFLSPSSSSTPSPPSSSSSTLSHPFPWHQLYDRFHLDPSEPFSSAFLDSISPIVVGSSLESSLGLARTLDDVVRVLEHYGEMMGPLEQTVEISYRLRNTTKVHRAKVKKVEPDLMELDGEADLARAIEESLKESGSSSANIVIVDDVTAKLEADDVIMDIAGPPAENPPPPPLPPSPILESYTMNQGDLIGTEVFGFDEEELDNFLLKSTQLWRGEREPVGVGLDQTSRCRTCEFEDGCEWLERKSQEILELNRLNRKGTKPTFGR